MLLYCSFHGYCLFISVEMFFFLTLHSGRVEAPPLQNGAVPIQAALFLISDHLSQWTPTLEAAHSSKPHVRARKCSVMNEIRNVCLFIYFLFSTGCQSSGYVVLWCTQVLKASEFLLENLMKWRIGLKSPTYLICCLPPVPDFLETLWISNINAMTLKVPCGVSYL